MIYFVRHGQTEYNVQNILGGNSNLTDLGKQQAQQAAEQFRDIHFDIIFVSNLKRTYQTAQIINQYHNVEIIVDDRLNERYYGDLELSDETKLDLAPFWHITQELKHDGVETIEQLKTRANSFMQYIKTNYPNKNILAVSHRGIGRIFKHIHGYEPTSGNLIEIGLNNGEYYTFEN